MASNWSARIVGGKKLTGKLRDMGGGPGGPRSLLNKKIMGTLAADAVQFIRRRTLAGFDVNDQRFEKYKEGYLEFKRKRALKFFSGGRVNLSNQEDMSRALQPISVTNRTATIGYTDAEEALKASGHNEGSSKVGLPKRKHFGLGKKGDARMANLLDKHLGKLIGR